MATISDIYDLPNQVPSLAQFDRGYPGTSFAVYHTVPFSAADLAEFLPLAAAEYPVFDSDDQGENDRPLLQLAPDADHTDQPLRTVVDAQIALAQSQAAAHESDLQWTFDPKMFLVITTPTWRADGVLIVSLNTDGKGGVDALMHPASGCATELANIQIGNSSWGEAADLVPEQPRPSSKVVDYSHVRVAGWDLEACGGHFAVYPIRAALLAGVMEALNGEETVEHLPRWLWPCVTPYWMNEIEMDGPGGSVSREESLGSIRKVHREWAGAARWKGHFHPSLVVVVDIDEFATEGVLVGEIGPYGEDEGESEFERVPAGEAAKVLVGKINSSG